MEIDCFSIVFQREIDRSNGRLKLISTGSREVLALDPEVEIVFEGDKMIRRSI